MPPRITQSTYNILFNVSDEVIQEQNYQSFHNLLNDNEINNFLPILTPEASVIFCSNYTEENMHNIFSNGLVNRKRLADFPDYEIPSCNYHRIMLCVRSRATADKIPIEADLIDPKMTTETDTRYWQLNFNQCAELFLLKRAILDFPFPTMGVSEHFKFHRSSSTSSFRQVDCMRIVIDLDNKRPIGVFSEAEKKQRWNNFNFEIDKFVKIMRHLLKSHVVNRKFVRNTNEIEEFGIICYDLRKGTGENSWEIESLRSHLIFNIVIPIDQYQFVSNFFNLIFSFSNSNYTDLPSATN